MGNPEPPNPQQPHSPPGPLPPQPGYAPPPVPPQPGYPAPPAPVQPGYGPPQQPPPGYGPPPAAGTPGYGTPPVPQQGYGPPQPGYAPPAGYGQPGHPYQGGQPVPPAKSGSRTGLIIGIVAGGVALLLLLVCGVGGYLWYRQSNNNGGDLSNVINYRETNPAALATTHVDAPVSYPMTPPAGGPHFQRWQNCNGDVYTAPIEDGNAVHSLEHGAVWITFRPGLPASEVGKLNNRVRGLSHMMVSPYPGQSSPISLQAWGYQLRVDDADDEAIDAFIQAYRVKAAIEPGAPCGGGITTSR